MRPKRPLKGVRPIGPVIDVNRSIDTSDSDNEAGDSNAPTNVSQLSEAERNVLSQAENWFEQITKEGKKRKMMKNYLQGITDDDFPESRIESLLDRAGL